MSELKTRGLVPDVIMVALGELGSSGSTEICMTRGGCQMLRHSSQELHAKL